jgi:hypothetical protein
MRLVVVEDLSPYISMHMKNDKINGCTYYVHQFEVKVILDLEIDSKLEYVILNWIGSPPWCVHLLVSSTPS